MIEWLKMGDYGFYVWTSVGAVVFALAMCAWQARSSFKKIREQLAWSRDAGA